MYNACNTYSVNTVRQIYTQNKRSRPHVKFYRNMYIYKYVSHQKHITPVSLLYTLSLLCAKLLEKLSVLLRFYFHEALRASNLTVDLLPDIQSIYFQNVVSSFQSSMKGCSTLNKTKRMHGTLYEQCMK